jgi:hypothetical protein
LFQYKEKNTRRRRETKKKKRKGLNKKNLAIVLTQGEKNKRKKEIGKWGMVKRLSIHLNIKIRKKKKQRKEKNKG